jgi:hypothetical protein
MADGSTRPVEQLKHGMDLMSSTGGATKITKILVVGEQEHEEVMVTIEYAISRDGEAQTSSYTATAFHLVTVLCTRSPAIQVADGMLSIGWLDAKTLKSGTATFRLATEEQPQQHLNDQSVLPADVSARAHEFACWWLRTQKARGLISPLFAGELFDVPAQQLHDFVNAKDQHTAYVREVVQQLGVPMCWAQAAPSSSSAAARQEECKDCTLEDDVSVAPAASPSSTPSSAVSLNTLIEQFRAEASSAVPVQKVAVATKKSVEQFAQMVLKRDDNAIEYAPAQEGVVVDVVYMVSCIWYVPASKSL